MTGEARLRGVLAGLVAVVIATGGATLVAREPAFWVQLVQLAHGALGVALLPLGALFVVVHVLQVFGVGARGARNVPWILIVGLVAVVVMAHPGGSKPLDGDQRYVANHRAQLAAMALGVYLAVVAVRALRRGIQASAPSGSLLVVVAVVLSLSGLLTVGGIAAPGVWRVHVVTSFVVLAAGLAHVLGSWRRRQRTARDDGRKAQPVYEWRAPLERVAMPTAAVLLAVVGGFVLRELGRLEPLTVDRTALVAIDRGLERIVPAACEGCHVSVSATWRLSTHAHAARNPVFTSLLRRLSAARGGDAVAECLTCHAPHAPDPRRVDLDAVLASDGYAAGVQCVTCHRMAEGGAENGEGITVEPLANDGFQFLSELGGPLPAWLRRAPPNLASTLFSGRIGLHRRQFRPALEAPGSCRPCHRQTLAAATHGRLDDVIQDQYGSWEASPAARDRVECAACHMPSFDAPEGYVVRDHRFLGGGTYVARIAGGDLGEADVVEHLRGGLRAPVGARTAGWPAERVPLLSLSARLVTRDGARVLRIETRNAGRVGHGFGEGPTDLIQLWLAVRVTDGDGRSLLDEAADAPTDASRLGTRLWDGAGRAITDHRLWAVERVEDRGRIPASGARVDERVLPSGDPTSPLTVALEWKYRRLDPELVRELTGGDPAGLPVVTVASLAGTVGGDRVISTEPR